MAAAIALIDASGIRPGTSRHARLSGARGAVTLLKSNVKVNGMSITLTFKAKGGKQVVKDVRAPAPGSRHQDCCSGCRARGCFSIATTSRSGRSASATSTRFCATWRPARYR